MANNATLSFGVVGPTMDFTTSVAVSGVNAGRILNYLANGTPYGTVTEADGTERQATTEESAQAFALGVLKGLLDQTMRYEKEQAARAAADAVSPIAPE